MSFENRYRKHKTFIENRWQPIDVKVLSEEDPKKKVSIDQKITIMNTDVISGKNKSLNGISLILSKKIKRGGNDAKIK